MIGYWELLGGILCLILVGAIIWFIKTAIPYDWAEDFGSMWDRFAK